jgi:4-amino-4-deoxy-L-arabinose transferase-like glycosyltransferase
VYGLFQLLFGPGVDSARLAAAAATLAGGAMMWWWVRSAAGRRSAVLAAAIWLLLPHWLFLSWGPRADRFALLEPVMIMFTLAAGAATWKWVATRSTLAMAVAAVCLALAVTSKPSAIAVAPVLVLYPLLRDRDRRAVGQSAAFAAIAAATAVATYLPSGNVVGSIAHLLRFQTEHNEVGHPFEVAGAVYQFQPWWANLFWLAGGLGVAVTVALVGCSVMAFLVGRDDLAVFVGLLLGSLLAFHLVISSVTLPHYYLVLVPWLSMLAALGMVAPWRNRRRAASARLRPAMAGRMTAIAAAVVLLVASIVGTVQTVTLRPTGVARVAAALADNGRPAGPVLVTGLPGWQYSTYLSDVTRNRAAAVAIVVHRGWARDRPDPRILTLVDGRPDRYRLIQLDDVELYLPIGR